MNYSVIVTENAKSNLRSYYLHAARRAPDTAVRWLNRFEEALATLAVRPQRCGFAPENGTGDLEIRQFLFGRRPNVFRALFAVLGDSVHVLHIRRATMDAASPDEILGA